MKRTCGIYKIANGKNGSFYIGASVHIERRFREHRIKSKRRGCKLLSRAIRKYGLQNFTLTVLEECDKSLLVEREMHWIASLKPRYNISLGPGRLGLEVPMEARRKLSAIGKAQWNAKSKEERELIVRNQLIGPAKGHDVSPETRDKIRIKLVGRKLPADHCNNISAALKGKPRANRHFNKGVAQIGRDGNEIARFESIKMAAMSVGISPHGITHQLSGKQKFAGGFTWKLT